MFVKSHAMVFHRAVGTDFREAKTSFTARRVPVANHTELLGDLAPQPGDLVLARVDSLGEHNGLQLATGRRARLYPGDQIVVCYGHRYATNQWEAIVPPTLGPCDLVATGGVAGKVLSRHAVTKRPTGLTPLGLLGNGGGPVNLRDYALEPIQELPSSPVPVIAVVGTTMDAGKTTTASALIRGLSIAGRRVGAIKLTGTGASGDFFQMVDAGAAWVADFVDAGFVSTYKVAPSGLELILTTLVGHAVAAGVDVIVAEIADGLVQAETTALLASDSFRRSVGTVLLAASDALGASAAVKRLCDAGLPLRAISGIASASTLSAIETRSMTDFPVLGPDDLMSPECAVEWIGS